MNQQTPDKQFRQYLLGLMPEPEQAALELAMLAEREKFDAAWEAETNLIDSYVRGELPTADHEPFERHYLASPLHRERVAIAKLLLQNIDQATSETAPSKLATSSWWQRWTDSLRVPQWALAAALLLVMGGSLWLWRERSRMQDQVAQMQRQSQAEALAAQERERALAAQKQEQENLIAQQRDPRLNSATGKEQPAAPPVMLSFLLTSVATRGNNTAPPIIPRGKGNVQLLMDLAGTSYTAYQAKVQTVEGRELFSKPVSLTKNRARAALVLPVKALKAGDYILILSGRNARHEQEEVDRYFFRVQ